MDLLFASPNGAEVAEVESESAELEEVRSDKTEVTTMTDTSAEGASPFESIGGEERLPVTDAHKPDKTKGRGHKRVRDSRFNDDILELVAQVVAAEDDWHSLLKTSWAQENLKLPHPVLRSKRPTGNEAKLKGGPAVSKYTGGTSKSGASDARAEFVAVVRKFLDDDKVTWQMAELGKMEKGGGGTISQYMARFGMDVIDFGTPLLNMHAPWELAAKEDCYWTYRAYRAYFEA